MTMFRKIRLGFEHFFNPLHVYCRMVDLGFPVGVSRYLCSVYERCLTRRHRTFGDGEGVL